MKTKQAKTSLKAIPKPLMDTLEELRQSLLELQRALLLTERDTYERVYGPIGSTNELIDLALNDPWFTWLLPISRLAVRLDEVTTGERNCGQDEVLALLAQARILLSPSTKGEGFERSYYDALQRDASAAMAHSHIHKLCTLAIAA
ncbi:MAG: hypothetical protein KF814_11125 [Nitrospiraceae bacterium]|nr:hypothetical protein [Nitrospiraceae bacterium]